MLSKERGIGAIGCGTVARDVAMADGTDLETIVAMLRDLDHRWLRSPLVLTPCEIGTGFGAPIDAGAGVAR